MLGSLLDALFVAGRECVCVRVCLSVCVCFRACVAQRFVVAMQSFEEFLQAAKLF